MTSRPQGGLSLITFLSDETKTKLDGVTHLVTDPPCVNSMNTLMEVLWRFVQQSMSHQINSDPVYRASVATLDVLSCILRSWLHEISALIMTLSPH